MHYTYAHIRLDTNTIFYIGKGKGERINNSDYRNNWWHNVVNKHGFVGIVLKEFETAKEAFKHEIEMILKYKNLGYKLVNQSNGGEGNNADGGFTFKGKKHTESAINKCKLANKDKPKTIESKLKNRLAHNKAIVINGVTYESGKKASEILNLPNTTISGWLNGRGSFMKSKYNWIFECYRPLGMM